MRNWQIGGVLSLLILGIVLMSGCSSTGSTSTAPVAVSATPTPTTTIPVTIITSAVTMSIPTITPNVTATSIIPIKTPLPKADATDVSEIKFLHYFDKDFSVAYPSTWTITNSTFTPYHCESVLDKTRNDYHICFENERKSFGPFSFYEDNGIKPPSRIVTFTSADGKLKFVSFTTDITDAYTGVFRLKQTPQWCQARFDDNYPDLIGGSYIGNYKFTQPPSNTFGISTYDVIMPKDSQYYPLAYSVESVVNMHTINEFAFITDNENFNKYQNLKDYMFSSITTPR